jgi:HSP20 family protein
MTNQELTPKEKQEVTDSQQTKPGRYYSPDVDIREDEACLRLWADVPGVEPGSMSVDFENDTLTIQGEVELADYEGLTPVYTEYNVGNFLRRFTFASSGRFDVDAIAARVADGVLTVEIPKAPHARQRRIPVNAG